VTNKLALVVAVALGILSIVGIRLYIQRVEMGIKRELTPVQVWVATQDLARGTKFVAADHVQEGEIPYTVAQQLNDTHIKQPEAYEGQPLVQDVAPGQVLQEYHFSEIGIGGTSLEGRLRPGYRAVSIPVDVVTGVTGFLRPGDRVDISSSMEFKDALGASDVKINTTRHVAKNVEILATGRILDRDHPRAGRSAFETITIALRPREVNRILHVYFNEGTLHCSYKEEQDSDPPGWSTVTDDHLFREIKDELRGK